MKITVKTFATIKDICGFAQEDITLADSSTVQDLLNILQDRHPGFESIRGSILLAKNEEYCSMNTRLRQGDTVALFPPVSGG